MGVKGPPSFKVADGWPTWPRQEWLEIYKEVGHKEGKMVGKCEKEWEDV